MDVNEEKNILLGYLSLFDTKNQDGKIGSVLITDDKGVPQEFRCSHPVKPTKVQIQLYGDTLEPYIGVHLCGIPLLNSLQLKPDLIITGKEFLLEVRESYSSPLVYIQRAGEKIEIETPEHKHRKRIDCPTTRFNPIIITNHHDYFEDQEVAAQIMTKVFSYLDPHEPFDRMKNAVEMLGNQDDRFL
jgi:hypothetical protein